MAANRRTFSLRHADGTPFTAAVYQPLGERAWPDVLCSVRGRGKGNEGKSRAGSDIVSWNSGRAVPGHLYMFLGRSRKGARRTVCVFDGTDTGFDDQLQRITDEELQVLHKTVARRMAAECPHRPGRPNWKAALQPVKLTFRRVHQDRNRLLGPNREQWLAGATRTMEQFLSATLRPS